MKILFLSTSIIPYPDMQAIRNHFLIEGLLKKGHEVIVITADYKWNSDKLSEKLNENLRIYKTKPSKYLRVSKFLSSKAYLKIVNKIYNVIVHYIAIPDIHAGWNKEALKKIKDIDDIDKIDLIISSSGSYSAHLLGKALRKNLNKPWIAEYGDPWGVDPYGKIRELNYRIEKEILKDCQGLIFTTQSTIDIYKTLYSDIKNIKLIPCGYDKVMIKSLLETEKEVKKIVYTGVAYKSSRNLLYAIESVATFKNVKLDMVGFFSPKYQLECKNRDIKNIDFMGRVEYKKSLDIISDADILLHIGNKGSLQIPGKTYIYLSSQNPILYVKQEENDPTEKLLSNFEGVKICSNNKKDITEALNDILKNYELFKRKSFERSKSEELKKYSWENIAIEFAEFIEETGKKEYNEK